MTAFWKTLTLLICLPLSSWAQARITFPVSRMVFQRNQSNQASVTVAGNYGQPADLVEVRLRPRMGGNAIDWRPLQQFPTGGFFQGKLDVSGGWYDVDIRTSLRGSVLETATLSRVGVGEVFFIAGQSNAQGMPQQTDTPEPQDDRVCVVSNFSNAGSNPSDPVGTPVFSKMTQTGQYGVNGRTSWHWGHLGDLLAAQLNVPILYINAAYEATGAYNWAESASGQSCTVYPYLNSICMPPGMPYVGLKTALQYYGNLLGLRSILWHQGEWDGQNGTAASVYRSQMETLIRRSRSDLGKNISWMVARVSLYPLCLDATCTQKGVQSRQSVLDGQNQTIATVTNVFAGPETDKIQVIRVPGDEFHFNGPTAHRAHAQAWFQSIINSNFLSQSQPVSALPMLQPQFACVGSGSFRAGLAGQGNVIWSNSAEAGIETGSTVLAKPNTAYLGRVRDGLGNSSFSPVFIAPTFLMPPTIEGINVFCPGTNTTLTARGQGSGFMWSNGQTGPSITVTSGGVYTVTATDGSCQSAPSPGLNVQVISNLKSPELAVLGQTVLCQGEAVTLQGPAGNYRYQWSNGATSREVSVGQSGSYSLVIRDAAGCISPVSSSIGVKVNPLPAAPLLSVKGLTTFCPDTSATLTASAGRNYRWNTGETTQSIRVSSSGNYSVQVQDENNCLSPSSNSVGIKVLSAPARQTISANKPLRFCEGGDVTLSIPATSDTIRWSNGANTPSITVKNSGVYTVSLKGREGCASPSTSAEVVAFVNPERPVITVAGSLTICDGQSVSLTSSVPPAQPASFFWNNGQRSQTIAATRAGRYTLKVVDGNGCSAADSAAPVNVVVNPVPVKPTLSASGPTTFCADKNVTLSVNQTETGYVWNTAATTKAITVNKMGGYRARTINSFNCASAWSDSIFLKVNPLPDPARITALSDTIFCQGSRVTLRSNSPLSETWSEGIQGTDTLTVTTSGDYSTRVTDANGCVSAPSNVIHVAVQAMPTMPVISVAGPYTLQATSTATLYDWKNAVGPVSTTQGPALKVLQAGQFSVRGRLVYALSRGDTLSCATPYSAGFAFTPSGIAAGWSVYPNPSTDGKLYVETAENFKNVQISIMTLTGKEVFSEKIPVFNQRRLLDLRVTPGYYILQLVAPGFRRQARILVGRP